MADMDVVQIRGRVDSIDDKSSEDKDYKLAVVSMQGLRLSSFGRQGEYMLKHCDEYVGKLCEMTFAVRKEGKYTNYDVVHCSPFTV